MGWEMRGGRRYYYKKRREGGRVISEYIGAGPLADLIVGMMMERRATDTQIAMVESVERTQITADENALVDFCNLTDALMRAHLHDAGYRQHHRGEWRKRRG